MTKGARAPQRKKQAPAKPHTPSAARPPVESGDASTSPKIFVLVTPDFKIAHISDEYARITLTSFQDVVGVRLFDVFPDNPHDATADGVSNLEASFQRVLGTGKAHRMRPQRYDIRDNLAGTSEWIEKVWNVSNTPVFGSGSSEVAYLVHEVEDITEAVQLSRWIEEQALIVKEQQQSLARMQRDLRSRRARLQSADEALTSHVRGAATRESIADVRARFGLPNLTRYFHTDAIVPETGIYSAHHEPACATAPARVFLNEGRSFPRCTTCRGGVFYRFMIRTNLADFQ